jgi:DNA-binding NarL/FixJ family response regulator
MPETEGLETIRALKRFDPAVKIIAMSVGGEGRPGYLQTAVTFGARATLHKPFSREQLLATLTVALAE